MHRRFIDRLVLSLAGGRGGAGVLAYGRAAHRRIAPASGGCGGPGGAVVVQASAAAWSLSAARAQAVGRRVHAPDGARGGTANETGQSGRDILITVPVGTVVRDADTGVLVADLQTDQATAELVCGGRGGRGNSTYSSSTTRSPGLVGLGQDGERMKVILELKSIADVGLIGFPNAGKSTWLAAVSNARPKIGNYPFTTLEPNFGVLSDGLPVTIADIPGIIEGASEDRGLGLGFLRHIERTSVLLCILDMSVGTHPRETHQRNPLSDLITLRDEITKYSPGLLTSRPMVVVANKMDTGHLAEQNFRRLLQDEFASSLPLFPASAQTGQGIEECMNYVRKLMAEQPS